MDTFSKYLLTGLIGIVALGQFVMRFGAALGFGVSLDLEAVQVIELANGGVSNVAAEAFGFTEEEGFVANGGETLDAVFSAEDNKEEEQATVTTADF